MKKCCNHDCEQGRTCPHQPTTPAPLRTLWRFLTTDDAGQFFVGMACGAGLIVALFDVVAR